MGLTVSMLGPDVPRDGAVDESLLPVLQDRLAELALAGGERPAALESISDMKSWGVFELAPLDPLPYDTVAYMKYEYSPSDDTAKKHLEMLNTVSIIRGRDIRHSLDIGTTTCRYPQFLERFGVPFTSGIDISSSGFQYMRSRGMSFARFALADGRNAPIRDQSIDLITCMMGTLNHLGQQQRYELSSEVRRLLAPGGIAVFGIWDTSCVYQSYLTMYSDSERAVFRTQPLSGTGFRTAAMEAGLSKVNIRRFYCFPDSFIYDLELESLGANEVERLCTVDFAVRARMPEAVGQMFLGVVEP
jgi:SAM-dependent methyltransferase